MNTCTSTSLPLEEREKYKLHMLKNAHIVPVRITRRKCCHCVAFCNITVEAVNLYAYHYWRNIYWRFILMLRNIN